MNPSSSFKAAAQPVSSEIRAVYAYPGIGVSYQAFILDLTMPPDLLDGAITEAEIPAELEKFEAALAQTIEQYDAIIAYCNSGQLPEDYAQEMIALIDFCKTVLIDDTFTGSIREKISECAGPAKTCVKIAEDQWADMLSTMDHPRFAAKVDDYKAICNRIIRNILGLPQPDLSHAPKGAIIIADSLSPTETIYFKVIQPAGVIVHAGSPSGHVGDFCKGMHISCAFIPRNDDFHALLDSAKERAPILNGRDGTITLNPSCEQRQNAAAQALKIKQREQQLESLKNAETIDADGRPFNLMGTAGNIMDIRELVDKGIKHIGLWRTEMIIISGIIPSEEEQIITYTHGFHYASGLTVRVRTFDFVGDKAFVGDRSPEQKYTDIKTQMRALLIAAGRSKISLEIMIPNIRFIQEARDCRKLLEDVYAELKAEGITVPTELPKFGIMLETPSAINCIKHIIQEVQIDFLSVGMNDATANYVSADRQDPHHDTYQDLLRREHLYYFSELFEKLDRLRISYSLCGAAAANETLIAIWYAMGVKAVSAPHGSVLEMRNAVAHLNNENTQPLLKTLFQTPYAQRRAALEAFCSQNNIGLAGALYQDTPQTTEPAAKLET